jgi:hypothetical protein
MARLGVKAGLKVAGCQARGVAGDHRLARNRIGVGIGNLLGLGDIMRMTFTPRAHAAEAR